MGKLYHKNMTSKTEIVWQRCEIKSKIKKCWSHVTVARL